MRFAILVTLGFAAILGGVLLILRPSAFQALAARYVADAALMPPSLKAIVTDTLSTQWNTLLLRGIGLFGVVLGIVAVLGAFVQPPD